MINFFSAGPAFSPFWCTCRRFFDISGQQPLQAGNIVRRCSKAEYPRHLGSTTVAQLSHQSNVFHPAKTLFNLFAFYLAYPVTLGARRAFVQLAATRLRGHMRRNFQPPTTINNHQQIPLCHIPCQRPPSCQGACSGAPTYLHQQPTPDGYQPRSLQRQRSVRCGSQ